MESQPLDLSQHLARDMDASALDPIYLSQSEHVRLYDMPLNLSLKRDAVEAPSYTTTAAGSPGEKNPDVGQSKLGGELQEDYLVRQKLR